MGSLLSAGIGRTDITPPLGTPLGGYPDRDRRAEAIRDPLHATALVLERNGLWVAIISLDWLVIDEQEVEAIRRGVQAQTGIAPPNVIVCAIQTHSAPMTQTVFGWGEKDSAYISAAIPKILESVAEATAGLQPAYIGIGVTPSDVGVNRRQIGEDHQVKLGVNPWGPIDQDMTVLRIEGQQGPIATLVHYGAHPTVFNRQSRVVSRDWPGVMLDRMEALTGVPALFINGAVGDVAPRSNAQSAVGDGEMALYEVGCRAATDALHAYRAVKGWADAELAVLRREIFLPYRPLPALDEARSHLAAAQAGKEQWGQPLCDYRHWQAVIEAHRGPIAQGRHFAQTLVRLGPLALVPFPGEPFAEIVLRLRQHSPFQHTLCASTTNGSLGYFATRESLHRGGYEVWVAKAFGPYILAENIDDVLVEENLKLLRELSIAHAPLHAMDSMPLHTTHSTQQAAGA